jgi:hypothetical protein
MSLMDERKLNVYLGDNERVGSETQSTQSKTSRRATVCLRTVN